MRTWRGCTSSGPARPAPAPAPIPTGPHRAGRSTISVAAGRTTWISLGGAACSHRTAEAGRLRKVLDLCPNDRVALRRARLVGQLGQRDRVPQAAAERRWRCSPFGRRRRRRAPGEDRDPEDRDPEDLPARDRPRRGEGGEAGTERPGGRIGHDSSDRLHGLLGRSDNSCTRNYLLYVAIHGTRTRHLRRPPGRHQPPPADARPPRGGRARRPARPRRLRDRRAPPPRLPRLLAGGRARGDRRQDRADPPLERGDRAQLRRSGPRLPGLRRARPDLRRAGRDHGRTGLVHRVVPALRPGPRRLRRPLRREARPPAEDPRRQPT